MPRFALMSGLLAATLLAPARASAQVVSAASLLDGLREEHREGLEAQLEVASLEELPLYDLHLAIDDRLRGFGLRETITYTNDERAPMSEMVLRLYANARGEDGAPVELIAGSCLDGVACTVAADGPSVIRVRLATPITIGERVRVQLDLRGRIAEIDPARTGMMAQAMEGFATVIGGASPGGGDYGLLARGEGIASLAQFFPVLARRDRGRWIIDDQGELGDLGNDRISNVRARIVVPRGMQVATSGLEVGSLPVRDPPPRAPRRELTIHAPLVRGFAVMCGAFESIARTFGAITVRSWYLARDREAGRRVLDVAASAVEIFERRFGPYPYRELDMVEAMIVGGAGGVEFSTLVTVASMFYRRDEGGLGALGDGTGTEDAMLEFVTAHEIAHQWWYGIVGNDERVEPWIDEALAQWSAILYIEERYGPARADEEARRQVAMGYRAMRMMGAPDGAVDRPASAFVPPITYGGLIYGKAPYLYRAIRTELGDAAFFAALQRYVAQHRFRMAPERGPIEALASGPHARRVRTIARRWLDEAHGDEDLGGGDAREVLGAILPSELQEQLRDPAVQAMVRQLMQRGLGDGDSTEDAAEMMEAIEALLGELPE